MTAPTYQAEPQIQYLYQLVRDIAEGRLQLPRFQRPYVWTEDQQLELFRSIHTGTPIGTIMLWQTTSLEMKCYSEIGGYALQPPAGHWRTYILDGHQRLATAFSALHVPPVHVVPQSAAYYDLEAEDFLLAAGGEPPEPCWLPLRYVLDFASFLPFQRKLMDQPAGDTLIRRADRLVKAFAEYKVPVVTVKTEDLEAITKTFQRVNSQGTVMSEVHMISALTWTMDFDLNEQIAALKEKYLAPIGWADLDDDVLLRASKLALGLRIYDKRVDEVKKRILGAVQVFDKITEALLTVIGFLGQECGIRSPRVLPYPSHLIPLIEAVRRHSSWVAGAERAVLARWFWTLAYSPRRSWPEAQLDLLDKMMDGRIGKPTLVSRSGRLDPLPRVFDFRSARCRSLALRMADLAGDGAADALARHGAGAAPHLLYGFMKVPQDLFESPANRIVVEPDQAPEERLTLREACQNKPRSKEGLELLRRHAIPPAAADAFAAGDLGHFYALRLRSLEEMENDFARNTGLLP